MFSRNRRVGSNDEAHVIINPPIRDGGASLEALNQHRRRLGLGPTTNLVSSGTSRPAESPTSHGSNTHHDIRRQQTEELFPFLSLVSPAHPYSGDNIDIPRRAIPQPSSADTESRLSGSDTPSRLEEGRRYSPAWRYRGDRALLRNRSADIPDEKNCRLWISGLPPNCTIPELLKEIKGVGPIYATHIVPPLINGAVSIPTSAASLTFFTAGAAHIFLLRNTIHPFTVGGYTTSVSRHKIRAKAAPIEGQSRVLVITGDPEIVNPEKLTSLFTETWDIRFDTDFMRYTPGKESNKIVWAFGSFRAQSQAIHIRLRRLSPFGIGRMVSALQDRATLRGLAPVVSTARVGVEDATIPRPEGGRRRMVSGASRDSRNIIHLTN
ncbi:hypothetical protein F4805DRAFT_456799 [Annulohypoxylon moriforme]|nr:hypothetical protein F4805DRAFT_456799 [Annulohypoxylon moriforme]